MDIGPGDWVECVDDSPGRPVNLPYVREAHLVRGRIYRVAAVRDFDHYKNGTVLAIPTVVLTERETHWIAWNGTPGGWHLKRFRPVYRPQADLIERLCADRPVFICEDA